jgi:type I restriction enzyme S subunit
MRALESDFGVFEGEGTLFGSISKQKYERMPVLAPDERVVTAFHTVATPIDDRILTSWVESGQLREVRDCLLPELISGRLKVRDAEQAVAEAV